jgi:hypothetical protein
LLLASNASDVKEKLCSEILQSRQFLVNKGINFEPSGEFSNRFNPHPKIDTKVPAEDIQNILYWSKKLQVPVDEINVCNSPKKNHIMISETFTNIFFANKSSITINIAQCKKHSPDRKIMSIMHELAHLKLEHHRQFKRSWFWLNSEQARQLRVIQEREADLYFALHDKEAFECIYRAVDEKIAFNEARDSDEHISYITLSNLLNKIRLSVWSNFHQ